WQVQIANVDNTGALRAARAAGSADVGAGWEHHERERAGCEYGFGVKSVQGVEYSEIGQRLIGCAEAQGIAQPVSRRGRCGGVCTAREIRDGLVEEITREDHCHGVGVLKIEDARRAISERVRRGYAVGIAAVPIEPLDRTRDIGERDAILRVGVE